jgi:dihydroxy-acid dehydratase
MEHFHAAGGVSALVGELLPLMHETATTVTGKTIAEDVAAARVRDRDVIASIDAPFQAAGTLVVLHGNLCPDGAILKSSAATADLGTHRGRAVVFEDQRDLSRRIDDPGLDVDSDSVLVLRNAGPVGGPGMPEWGHIPIPSKLLEQGVRDMVRISDARMSGTAYGTCILHVAPESAVGGPLGLAQDGDVIELDVPNRRLTLDVAPEELEARRRAWKSRAPKFTRGYGRLYLDHVSQAPQGADLDFLRGGPGVDLAPYQPIKTAVEDRG